jgi:hypothetical protein
MTLLVTWTSMHPLKEKLSFETCLMQLQVSCATKKCRMQLFFSCMRHV